MKLGSIMIWQTKLNPLVLEKIKPDKEAADDQEENGSMDEEPGNPVLDEGKDGDGVS